jgi:hypothetical protein
MSGQAVAEGEAAAPKKRGRRKKTAKVSQCGGGIDTDMSVMCRWDPSPADGAMLVS